MYSVIQGFEVSTCAGEEFSKLWHACLEKKSFINSEGLGPVQSSTYLKNGNPIEPLVSICRNAIEKTLGTSEDWNHKTGIILATTTGHTAAWEQDLINYLSNRQTNHIEFTNMFSREPLGYLLKEVQKLLSISGPSTVVSTACSASTHAIGLAHTWLQLKKIKRCMVVSTELLCLLTTTGFTSFNLLSKSPSKPFDKDRSGINLSEAFACLCIESVEEVSDKDIFVAGFGASTDTHLMTTPDPEGRGTIRSILMALENSKTSPVEVDFIHCHGTASQYNDLAEVRAIKSIWKEKQNRPFFTSTKGVHGHALGASGLIETCIVAQSLIENKIPPTTGFANEDEELGASPLVEPLEKPISCAIKNTLGFGGANASLVLKKGEIF